MTLSPRSCHSMMHRLTAAQQEQSWLQQHNCTWRGVKVWTTVVLGGFLTEVSAIPSQALEIAVGDHGRVSGLCTALGTKLASLIHIAIMMCIVSRVSTLSVFVSLIIALYMKQTNAERLRLKVFTYSIYHVFLNVLLAVCATLFLNICFNPLSAVYR